MKHQNDFHLHSDIFYPSLKIITTGNGCAFYTRAIIINGVNRIMQELSNTGTVIDTQTN